MRLRLVEVVGGSMSPALREGDLVLVRWGAPAKPGAVVVASFPDAPAVLVVKRVLRVDAAGAWLVGDNVGESDDSRLRGAIPLDAVRGRVLFRWRRARQPRASSA